MGSNFRLFIDPTTYCLLANAHILALLSKKVIYVHSYYVYFIILRYVHSFVDLL